MQGLKFTFGCAKGAPTFLKSRSRAQTKREKKIGGEEGEDRGDWRMVRANIRVR